MIKVLFICTGNTCRSQMAEGFLKSYPNFEVFSAGTNPDKEVQPSTIRVMNEIGIDISNQKPKSVTVFLDKEFDFVVTVCDGAKEKCPIFLGKVKHRKHIGFEDPFGQSITKYREIRDSIDQKIKQFVDEINNNI